MTSRQNDDYQQRNQGRGGNSKVEDEQQSGQRSSGDGHSSNQFSDDDARGQTSQRDGSVAGSDGYGRPVRNTKNSQQNKNPLNPADNASDSNSKE